ncbi:lamina-associated polypeptide 2-like [Rhinophrynus dorsalis]
MEDLYARYRRELPQGASRDYARYQGGYPPGPSRDSRLGMGSERLGMGSERLGMGSDSRHYASSAAENYGSSGGYPSYRQEREQGYDGRQMASSTAVPDMGDAVETLIRAVLDTLNISGVELCEDSPVDASEDPSKNLFKPKTKFTTAFPAYAQLDQIVTEEWKHPDRKVTLSSRFEQMYPFAKECVDLWGTPPVVDPLFFRIANQMALPVSDSRAFNDATDKKMETLSHMSFISSGAALRPSFAIAWVSRAMGQWCEDLAKGIRQGAPKADLLRMAIQIQEANLYLGDAALDAAKYNAKASGLSVAARRALWLKLSSADPNVKKTLITLPFLGKVLFGPELQKYMGSGVRRGPFPQSKQKNPQFQQKARKNFSQKKSPGPPRSPKGPSRSPKGPTTPSASPRPDAKPGPSREDHNVSLDKSEVESFHESEAMGN